MDTLIATLREALDLLEDYAAMDESRNYSYIRRLSLTRESLIIIIDSLEDVTKVQVVTPPAV
jgi:hypothetical protein